jgi:hypothetical protein
VATWDGAREPQVSAFEAGASGAVDQTLSAGASAVFVLRYEYDMSTFF